MRCHPAYEMTRLASVYGGWLYMLWDSLWERKRGTLNYDPVLINSWVSMAHNFDLQIQT